MLQLFAYAIGIMYTPGPVNLLALNAGIQGQARHTWGFHLGVGLGLLIPLSLLSVTGAQLVTPERLRWLTLVGCGYILYLAWKIARASLSVEQIHKPQAAALRFRDGLLMQLLNPKGMIACLPIATLYMPTLHLSATGTALICILLATLGSGAPAMNALIGHWVGLRLQTFSAQSPSVKGQHLVRGFNLLMALLLVYAAVTLFWSQWHPEGSVSWLPFGIGHDVRAIFEPRNFV